MRVPVCMIPKAGGLVFYWPGFEDVRGDLDDQKTEGSSEGQAGSRSMLPFCIPSLEQVILF